MVQAYILIQTDVGKAASVAAAIAELAARWTPTGSDLGTEAAAAETEPDQTGSDTSTDSEDGSDPADPPRGSTTAAADDATS